MLLFHIYFISIVSCFGLTSIYYLVSTFSSVAIWAQDDWSDDVSFPCHPSFYKSIPNSNRSKLRC